MWIETEIKEVFQSRAGLEMVRFTAIKGGGQLWAAPAQLVRQGLAVDALAPGERVEIEVVAGRLVAVRSQTSPRQGSRETGRPPSGAPGRVGSSSSEASTMATTIPYGFVPIDVDHVVADRPVLHDGSGSDGTDGGELLSGEILCSLTARTPLLPGNARYPCRSADYQKLTGWGVLGALPEKQIAEPLRLDDGRVVIAGSALKGMLRMSLSVLFSAPMERVRERHFTYRPNLGHANTPQLECRPAIVREVSQDTMDVDVLPAQSAIFVHGRNAARALSGSTMGAVVSKTANAVYLDFDRRTGQKRLKDDAGGRPFTLRHYLFFYAGGMDGTGIMAKAFNGKRTHNDALVSEDDVLNNAQSAKVSKEVIERYRKTQKVLADNEAGHLVRSHPLAKDLKTLLGDKWAEREGQGILAATELKKDQLIFVEVEDQKGTLHVRSLGHNYQYRSAYTSSIRKKDDKPRECLRPTASEQATEADGRPQALTAARLMFGYVRDDDMNPVGKKDTAFTRFAGRIAVNHALSEENPKFLGDPARGYCVPLPILGQPKPSAWEFYLDQNASGQPATYGDLPSDAGGDLAGRKYYRHQPTVQNIKGDAQAEASDQATIARCICAPGTKFKFAVRFARLREWELGALMAVLTPEFLGEAGKTYAHKLGLGRPLGMGSVRIAIDTMRVRCERECRLPDEDNRSTYQDSALQALRDKQSGVDHKLWLKMHEYARTGRIAFPVRETTVTENGQKVKRETIYAWHTKIRRDYSRVRREKVPDWTALSAEIKEATGE